MHIVLANQWYPPESGWGGVAMANYVMAHAYREMGHPVTIIASRTCAATPAVQESGGIRIHRLLVRDGYGWKRIPGIGYYVRPVQQLAYSWRVRHTLRKLHAHKTIDVVEFTDVNAEGFFYARSPQFPVVVRCQTPNFVLKRYYLASEMPFDTRIIGWSEGDLIRRAQGLIAPSRDMAQVIAAECNLPLQNISVIPNALSISDFRPPCERPNPSSTKHSPTILHVGRLERAKGLTVLAKAVPLVMQSVPDARFIFAGADRHSERGGSQRAELEQCLAEANVLSRVEFLGSVEQARLPDLYQQADICVVPSMLYESFSYTSAQAMAAGKPVIASRIGGIPETVEDGITGVLVAPGNVEELAEAIIRLARDPGLRERMGRAGRARVAHEFDPQSLAQRNLEQYERARQRFCRMVV